MLYYAGIGSRTTPDDVQAIMQNIGHQLADKWTLRSGFADGADKAFAYGADEGNGLMENFLPWAAFNGAPRNDDRFIVPKPTEAMSNIAAHAHSAWDKCSSAAKLMHTRNVCQVLGHDLKTHSNMVICWTPNGSGSGGTGQAIRIARTYGIPVFDLALEASHQALVDFVFKCESKPKPLHPITITNKHHGKAGGVYVGRGSPLGNPFPIEGKNTRGIVIAQYRMWLKAQVDQGNMTVIDEMHRLHALAQQGPLDLECFCAPKQCHAEFIRELLIEMHKAN